VRFFIRAEGRPRPTSSWPGQNLPPNVSNFLFSRGYPVPQQKKKWGVPKSVGRSGSGVATNVTTFLPRGLSGGPPTTGPRGSWHVRTRTSFESLLRLWPESRLLTLVLSTKPGGASDPPHHARGPPPAPGYSLTHAGSITKTSRPPPPSRYNRGLSRRENSVTRVPPFSTARPGRPQHPSRTLGPGETQGPDF